MIAASVATTLNSKFVSKLTRIGKQRQRSIEADIHQLDPRRNTLMSGCSVTYALFIKIHETGRKREEPFPVHMHSRFKKWVRKRTTVLSLLSDYLGGPRRHVVKGRSSLLPLLYAVSERHVRNAMLPEPAEIRDYNSYLLSGYVRRSLLKIPFLYTIIRVWI